MTAPQPSVGQVFQFLGGEACRQMSWAPQASNGVIGAATNLSKSTVLRAIKRLNTEGLIRTTAVIKGYQQSNVHQIGVGPYSSERRKVGVETVKGGVGGTKRNNDDDLRWRIRENFSIMLKHEVTPDSKCDSKFGFPHAWGKWYHWTDPKGVKYRQCQGCWRFHIRRR